VHKPEVAIIGAGIGGLTLAILLGRAGYPTTVYEQAPQIMRLGAGINLAPNFTRIMRALGLEATLQDIGLCPDAWRSCQWDTGEDLLSFSMSEYCSQHFDAPYLILHRGDLHAAIANAVPEGMVKLGKRLVGLEPGERAVQLSFADGSVASAAIVVGADGIKSTVRTALIGPEPPVYSGHVAYRAIFPAHLLDGLEIADNTKWWAPERHFIAYFLTRNRDEVYFVTGSPASDWDEEVSFVPAGREEMLQAFEGFHPDVGRIIQACPEASKWALLERPPRAVWSEDRVVLLGDACHPMKPHMGQGAGMAVEDAVVLFRCIEANGGEDPRAAFQRYETARFERTSRVQIESRQNTWLMDRIEPHWVWGYDALSVALPGDSPAN
jgi:6-hydroxynicotinate 3-monooxygenase